MRHRNYVALNGPARPIFFTQNLKPQQNFKPQAQALAPTPSTSRAPTGAYTENQLIKLSCALKCGAAPLCAISLHVWQEEMMLAITYY